MAATTLNTWRKTQTSPAWRLTLQTDGGAGKDITGVPATSLQLLIESGGIATYGTGTFTIIQASPPAVVLYKPSPADSAVAGTRNITVIINPSDPDFVGPYQWIVQ